MAKKYPWEVDTIPQQKVTGASATDVNLLRNIITSSQGASSSYDPKTTGFLNNILSKAGAALNVKGSEKGVAFRSDIADIRTAIRNYISGAAVSKYEAAELEDLIPKPGESDTKVKEKLKKLQERSIVKVGNILQTSGIDQTGEQYLKTNVVNPQEQQKEPFNLVDWLKNTATYKYGQDIGVGMGMNSKDGQALQQSQQNALDMAERARQKAATVSDPEQKRRLLEVSGQTANVVGQGAQEQQQQFSKDIDKPYWQRGLEVGSEIASAAEAANIISNIPKTITNVASKARNLKSANPLDLLKPSKKVDKLFKEGVSEAKQKFISGDDLVNSIDDLISTEKANITSKASFKNSLDAVKNSIKGRNLDLKYVRDEFIKYGQGYTEQGVVRTAADSAVDRIIRKSIRKEVAKIGADKIITSIEAAAKATQLGKQWKWLINPSNKGGGVNWGGLSSKAANAAAMALILKTLGIGSNRE